MQYVIEADGKPEPALAFIQQEFQIIIGADQIGNILNIQLKLGAAATYEIYFHNVQEGQKFVDELAPYTRNRAFVIQ